MTVDLPRFHRLAVAGLVVTLVLVVTGAAVRLTGSGLGCADWPGCEEQRFVPALELNPMVEFVNRVLSAAGGLLALVVGLAALRLRPWRRDLVVLCVAIGSGYLVTGLLGAVVVAYHLTPQIVSAHLLLSLLLVGLGTMLAVWSRPGWSAGTPGSGRMTDAGTRRLVVAALVLLAVAVVVGTVVTGSGPHGGDEDAPRYGYEVGDVARFHSLSVIAFLLVVLVLLGRLGRPGASADVRRRAQELLGVSAAQAAVGWVQFFTDVPVVLVGIHILGAALVWLAAVRLAMSAWARLDGCPSPPRPSRSSAPLATPSSTRTGPGSSSSGTIPST